MTTIAERKEEFDSVRMMREIRESLNRETEGMTYEEQKRFIQRELGRTDTVTNLDQQSMHCRPRK